ncbi:hypothetical protein LWE61_18530 [Sphingobium sufflavum]|uniref:hypothetical protein n=1 Tax=Sphingobium sufflavum TaxID=1129547 RepID=UPI001F37BC45|nr:hypothetical protein [Sphingobium sufflavum]MCE7798532.1 hypothetical protein [Sphingobium sufflavum]
MKYYLPLTLAAALLVTGCDKKNAAAPTGQVVATVNGQEITFAELRQEMDALSDGVGASDNLQNVALQSIIARNLISQAAVAQKLDQLPSTAMLQKKASQMALVDALTQKLREQSPAPGREEVEQFIIDHPASYAQHSVFVADQLIIDGVNPPLVKAMEPIETLEEIEALLKARGIPFRRSIGAFDALSISPDAAEQISVLAPGSVFVTPQADSIRVNRLRETVIDPIPADKQVKLASITIQNTRRSQIVANKINEILTLGQGNVKYNAKYDPKKLNPPKK